MSSCPAVAGGYTSRQILDIVFILRVLRLIRVVDSIKRFDDLYLQKVHVSDRLTSLPQTWLSFLLKDIMYVNLWVTAATIGRLG